MEILGKTGDLNTKLKGSCLFFMCCLKALFPSFASNIHKASPTFPEKTNRREYFALPVMVRAEQSEGFKDSRVLKLQTNPGERRQLLVWFLFRSIGS